MDGVLAGVAERWRALDPLLPGPSLPAGAPGLAVPGAVGAPRQLSPQPGSALPMWFAAHRFSLRPLVAGPDVAGALDRLLAEWSTQVRADPRAADEDSAAYVYVPSRDTETFHPLLSHGLVPYVVVAARTVARPVTAGATIRRAGPGDLAALSELALAQARSELEFGSAIDRPDVAERLRAELAEQLDTPDPWVWLAEIDGRVVGALSAERPDANDWLAPFTDLRPIGYVRMARIEPAARGAGVGAALTAAAHHAFDDAGIACTLLHYSLLNPRSGPFWHRMGYRPLWTAWKATPAAALH
ncbi:MAG TPA: GNAT family N-acetyltransferase [Mycobacteriales bacterium]|nr:GNAT family N-acetyltransferase [Mycobacteriales bacterium]